jgi:hypothetical protein
MKTTYSIAAIAMFAVILGMSALAPAMASKPIDGVDHKIQFCHYQEAKEAIYDLDEESVTFGDELVPAVPEAYLVIETDKKGQMNGHFKNKVAHHFPTDDYDVQNGQGDFLFDSLDLNGDPIDDPLNDHDSALDCEAFDAALVSTDEVLASTDKAEA